MKIRHLKFKRSIFWFKRDLRIDDNRGFFYAYQNSREIIPIFIFIEDLLKKLKAFDSRLDFIIDLLNNLDKELSEICSRLFCFYGDPENIFERLIKTLNVDSVITNRANGYFGENLDNLVKKICSKYDVNFISIQDSFIGKIDKIGYKKVYFHFYKEWIKNLDLDICEINKNKKILLSDEVREKLSKNLLSEVIKNIKYEKNKFWSYKLLEERIKNFDFLNYEKTRNRLDLDGTSKLSPFIKFGAISLRKLFCLVKDKTSFDSQFLKELAWREFWYHIKFNFPEFKDLEFQEKRRNIKWENDEKFYKAITEAKTGYPIIDAAVIQLKTENWMYNRARMIFASFWCKDLLLDWRLGEKFFSYYLLDYDEIVNLGNWQWASSVGPDPKPLRIFNPVLQAKKFDPEAKYIKKYIPELKDYPPYMLLDPIKYNLKYYKPIVNHKEKIGLIKKYYLKDDF